MTFWDATPTRLAAHAGRALSPVILATVAVAACAGEPLYLDVVTALTEGIANDWGHAVAGHGLDYETDPDRHGTGDA